MRLYHFTCSHGRAALGDVGELLPARDLIDHGQPGGIELPPWAGLVWLTDMGSPFPRESLGLTRTVALCDRTRYRYRTTLDAGIVPWLDYSRGLDWSYLLNLAPGVHPGRWYVSEAPVPVVFDQLIRPRRHA